MTNLSTSHDDVYRKGDFHYQLKHLLVHEDLPSLLLWNDALAYAMFQ